MTQQNHRANVWITPETREQLKAIGQDHGAAKGRELSPGIRVAAGFHGRLVEIVKRLESGYGYCDFPSEDERLKDGDVADARALLKEIEEAR